MAIAVSGKEKEKERQSGQQQTAQNVQSTQSAQQKVNAYTGLQGLTGQTQNQIGKLNQGYTPSQRVTDAQQYIQQIMAQKPEEYKSGYSQQLQTIYEKIMNREPFKYDLNGDMLYRQYADQYTRKGQQAMQDAMGQAAALTGGYGSSYGATAGSQAYQQYLTQLNGMVPELYDRAYQRYQGEGDELTKQYQVTQNADDTAYSRYQNQLAQWNTDADRAHSWGQQDYENDYNEYINALNYWLNLAAKENSDYYTGMEYNWKQQDRDAAAAAAAAAAAGRRTWQGQQKADEQIKTKNKKRTLGGLSFYERSLIDNAERVKAAADKNIIAQKTKEYLPSMTNPSLYEYMVMLTKMKKR